jgi:hypothetical protein
MRFPRLTKRQWLLVSILLVLYGAGYGWARSQSILIHRVAFATEGTGRSYFHSVSTGDFGPGLLQGRVTPLIVSGCYWVFTPLRWLESFVWVFIPRHENAA